MKEPRQPDHADIAVCAYFIWQAEGCPEGRQREHWDQAEMQLEATRAHEQWVSPEAGPALSATAPAEGDRKAGAARSATAPALSATKPAEGAA